MDPNANMPGMPTDDPNAGSGMPAGDQPMTPPAGEPTQPTDQPAPQPMPEPSAPGPMPEPETAPSAEPTAGPDDTSGGTGDTGMGGGAPAM